MEARKAEREAYKQSLANAAKAKEDAIIAEKEAKEQEKKDQQKAAAGQKKLLKKLRRKWNKYCEELDVDDENVSDLVEILGLEEGKFFWGGTSSYKHTLEIYFSSRNE